MSERFTVAYSPEKGGGGGKKEPTEQKKTVERIPPAEVGIIGKLRAKFGSKEMQKKIRQQKNYTRREAGSQKHLGGAEELKTYLSQFDKALGKIEFQDLNVAKFAKQLSKKLFKMKSKKGDEERDKYLTAEARQYIFLGLIPREDEPAGEKGVARHIRTYLMWRWAEEEWKKTLPGKWKVWRRTEREEREAEEPETPESYTKFNSQLREWTQRFTTKEGMTELPRPPQIPNNNLVVMIAKRVGEDHIEWQIDPIKPNFVQDDSN